MKSDESDIKHSRVSVSYFLYCHNVYTHCICSTHFPLKYMISWGAESLSCVKDPMSQLLFSLIMLFLLFHVDKAQILFFHSIAIGSHQEQVKKKKRLIHLQNLLFGFFKIYIYWILDAVSKILTLLEHSLESAELNLWPVCVM